MVQAVSTLEAAGTRPRVSAAGKALAEDIRTAVEVAATLAVTAAAASIITDA